MAKLKLSLDHHPNLKGQYPIKLVFGSNSKEYPVGTGVFIQKENWDKKEQTILPGEPKFKRKNQTIQEIFEEAEIFVEKLSSRGQIISDAKKLRDLFLEKDKPKVTFLEYFKQFCKNRSGRTKDIYVDTYNKVSRLIKPSFVFEEITPRWLDSIDKIWIKQGNKTNTRAIHFRNIRAVFNNAIDDEIIGLDKYPFRRYKIKKEETAKRALSLDDFRKVMAFSGSEQENWARDVFMLSFYLIGINMVDLFNLKEIENGYTSFNRSKTKRLYIIKVENEALEIIDRMKGQSNLLNFADQFKHDSNFRNKVNDYLEDIADKLKIKKFTTYAARHSWATYASELEINQRTISAALGHGKKDVTDTYIDFNMKKVDKANREVIDWVKK